MIARNPTLIESLRGAGFLPGLEPAPAAIARMGDLAATLLRAFDGMAPTPGTAGPALAGSSSGAAQPGVDVAGPGLGRQPADEAADALWRGPVGERQPVALAR